MRKIFLALTITLLTATAQASRHYVFQRLNVTNGLSSNYVNSLAQDRTGFIWAATESGLSRFDGNSIRVFTTSNSDIPSNEINVVLADTLNNTLWIGTRKDGCCIIDLKDMRMNTYNTSSGLLSNNVNSLAHAADGGVWITHYYAGIDHFDTRSGKITSYRLNCIEGSDVTYWCTADDGKGHLYIGYSDGLCVYDLKNHTCRLFSHKADDPYSIPGNHARKVFIDRNDNVWVGTNNGLALFNPQNGRFISFRTNSSGNGGYGLLGDQVNDIGQSADGTIWICTHMGGVSTLNLSDNAFRSPEETHFGNIVFTGDKHGISSPNARCFLQDRFGNIWIGNYRGGIDFLSHDVPQFHTLRRSISYDETVCSNQVWGVAADNDGRLWVGGENEICIFEDKQLKKTISLTGIAKPFTHTSVIYRDSKGLLWFGLHQNGVLTCNPHSGQPQRISLDNDYVDVTCFHELADGRMLIGSQSGLYSCSGGKVTKEDKINSQLPNKTIHGIVTDRHGNLWMGTFESGVVELNGNGKLIRHFDETNGLTNNAVNALYMDNKGGLWIAHRNGLAYIADTDNPKPEVYGNAQGLRNLNVRAVTADANGNIWLSTNAGIALWDKAKRRFYNFSRQQGVPPGDFMDASVCAADDGMIYFGSQYGVCSFQPAEIKPNEEAVNVFITEVKGYKNSSIPGENEFPVPIEDKKITLHHNENNFTIVFGVVDYTFSAQTEYEYQMDGLGKNIFQLRGENQVTFRDLKPGHYTFRVRAKLYDQEWSNNFTSLKVTILPPLWLEWYALLFYFLLVVAATYGVVIYYKHRLQQKNNIQLERQQFENGQKLNEERLRFYTNITHELRTPLTLILGPLEDLLADKTLSPRHANKISIINDSATRLLNLINQILEFRKTETQNRQLLIDHGDLASLVQGIGLQYKELNRNDKVSINVDIATKDTYLYFDPEIVTIIIDNLLSNAKKYTESGTITLRLAADYTGNNRYTLIQVKDTGYGISQEALPHIFQRYYQEGSEHQASGSGIGLALVKSLVELHEGAIDVESHIGDGSTFTVRLLTDNTYPNANHKDMSIKKESTEEVVESEKSEFDETEESKQLLLVVEDNKDICEYIRSSFCDTYTVLTAHDGKDGLELAQSRIPDIIVSDIMMPVMDGIALCKEVKGDVRTSHIPVILLTAKSSIQDKEDGYEAGADSFITKPFSARLLRLRMENLIESRRRLARLIGKATTDISAVDDENSKTSVANESKDEAQLNALDKEFLEKARNIIRANMGMEKMDVAFIADKMCMSHSTLYRKIKGLTNMSVNEFVRKLKMQMALELLKSNNHTIADISLLTGFSSVAYFRQCFKEEFGVTPSEYSE
jgi:signal transduction histidine kinase/ligand-binding sensor domain-containing protein/DNA-binding response OmpR family regulator